MKPLFFIGLISLTLIVWTTTIVIIRRIRQKDKNAISQYMGRRYGVWIDQEPGRAKLARLSIILGVSVLSSLFIAAIALLRALISGANSSCSFDTAFFWSSGLLFFSSIYGAALWTLIASALRKINTD